MTRQLLPVLMMADGALQPFPHPPQLGVNGHQGQGERLKDGEQNDTEKCGEPEPVHWIHDALAQEDAICGEDLEQRITTASATIVVAGRCGQIVAAVKTGVEQLQVQLQMRIQSEYRE